MAFIKNIATSLVRRTVPKVASNLFPSAAEKLDKARGENLVEAKRIFDESIGLVKTTGESFKGVGPVSKKFMQQLKTGEFGTDKATAEARMMKRMGMDMSEFDELDKLATGGMDENFDLSSFDSDTDMSSFDTSDSSSSTESFTSGDTNTTNNNYEVINNNSTKIVRNTFTSSSMADSITAGEALLNERLVINNHMAARLNMQSIEVSTKISESLDTIREFLATNTQEFYTASLEHYKVQTNLAENLTKSFEVIDKVQKHALKKIEDEEARRTLRDNMQTDDLDNLFNPARLVQKFFDETMWEMIFGDMSPIRGWLEDFSEDPLGTIAAFSITTGLEKVFGEQIDFIRKEFDVLEYRLQETFNIWANNFEGGFFNTTKRILGEFFKVDRESSGLVNIGRVDLEEPATFDMQTRKAIVDVIPMYLSKILKAVSGRKGKDFEVYDYKTNSFRMANDIHKETLNRVKGIAAGNNMGLGMELDNILYSMNASEYERNTIRKHILESALKSDSTLVDLSRLAIGENRNLTEKWQEAFNNLDYKSRHNFEREYQGHRYKRQTEKKRFERDNQFTASAVASALMNHRGMTIGEELDEEITGVTATSFGRPENAPSNPFGSRVNVALDRFSNAMNGAATSINTAFTEQNGISPFISWMNRGQFTDEELREMTFKEMLSHKFNKYVLYPMRNMLLGKDFTDEEKENSTFMQAVSYRFEKLVTLPMRRLLLGREFANATDDELRSIPLMDAIKRRVDESIVTPLKTMLLGREFANATIEEIKSTPLYEAIKYRLEQSVLLPTKRWLLGGNEHKAQNYSLGKAISESLDRKVLLPIKKALLGDERSIATAHRTSLYQALKTGFTERVIHPLNEMLFGRDKREEGFWSNLSNTVSPFFNKLLFGEHAAAQKGFIENLKEAGSNIWKNTWNGFKNHILFPITQAIKDFFGPTLKEFGKTLGSEIKDFSKTIFGKFTNGIRESTSSGIREGAKNLFKNVFGDETVQLLRENVVKPLQKLTQTLTDHMSKAFRFLLRLPINFLRGITDTMKLNRIRSGRGTYSREETARLMELERSGKIFNFLDLGPVGNHGHHSNATNVVNSVNANHGLQRSEQPVHRNSSLFSRIFRRTPREEANSVARAVNNAHHHHASNLSNNVFTPVEEQQEQRRYFLVTRIFTRLRNDNIAAEGRAARVMNRVTAVNSETAHNVNNLTNRLTSFFGLGRRNETPTNNTQPVQPTPTRREVPEVKHSATAVKSAIISINTKANAIPLIATNTTAILSFLKKNVRQVDRRIDRIYNKLGGNKKIGKLDNVGGVSFFKNPIRWVGEQIKITFSGIFKLGSALLNSGFKIVTALATIPGKIIGGLVDFSVALANTVLKASEHLVKGIGIALNGILEGLGHIISATAKLTGSLLNSIGSFASAVAGPLGRALGQAVGLIADFSVKLGRGLIPIMQTALEAIGKLAKGLVIATEGLAKFAWGLLSTTARVLGKAVDKITGKALGIKATIAAVVKISNFDDLLKKSHKNPMSTRYIAVKRIISKPTSKKKHKISASLGICESYGLCFINIAMSSRRNPLHVIVRDGKIATYDLPSRKRARATVFTNNVETGVHKKHKENKRKKEEGKDKESSFFKEVAAEVAGEVVGNAIGGAAKGLGGLAGGLLGGLLARRGAASAASNTAARTGFFGRLFGRRAADTAATGAAAAGARAGIGSKILGFVGGVGSKIGGAAKFMLARSVMAPVTAKGILKGAGLGALVGIGGGLLADGLFDRGTVKHGLASGAASGAGWGMTIGSIIPGVGTAVGGLIGGVIGALWTAKDAIVKWIEDNFGERIKAATEWLVQVPERVHAFVEDLPNKINDFVASIPVRMEGFLSSLPIRLARLLAPEKVALDENGNFITDETGPSLLGNLFRALGAAFKTVIFNIPKIAVSLLEGLAKVAISVSITATGQIAALIANAAGSLGNSLYGLIQRVNIAIQEKVGSVLGWAGIGITAEEAAAKRNALHDSMMNNANTITNVVESIQSGTSTTVANATNTWSIAKFIPGYKSTANINPSDYARTNTAGQNTVLNSNVGNVPSANTSYAMSKLEDSTKALANATKAATTNMQNLAKVSPPPSVVPPMLKAPTSTSSYSSNSGSGAKYIASPVVSSGSGGNFSAGTGGTGAYAAAPRSRGIGWAANKDLILYAARVTGADPVIMAQIAAQESAFDPRRKSRDSTATGLFQFIDKTWRGEKRRNAARYGVPLGAHQTDPVANAILGGSHIRDNAKDLSTVKPNVTAADIYAAHFLGLGGAKRFLRGLAKNPNQPATALVSPDQARSKTNRAVFFHNGRPRTAAALHAWFGNKIVTKAKALGVDIGGIGGVSSNAAVMNETTDSGSMMTGGGGFEGSGGMGGAMPSTPPAPDVDTQTARALYASYFNKMLKLNNSMGAVFTKKNGEELNIESFKMNGWAEPAAAITGATAAMGVFNVPGENSVLASTTDGAHPLVAKAADIATRRAEGKSVRRCSKYVRTAMQMAGIKYQHTTSAIQAHTWGRLKKAGFQLIPDTGKYLKGDILVFEPRDGNPHGHIQIWNGHQWVSDFRQKSKLPGTGYRGKRSYLYRLPYSASKTPVAPPASIAKIPDSLSPVNPTPAEKKAKAAKSSSNTVSNPKEVGTNSVLAPKKGTKYGNTTQVGKNTVLAPNVTANNIEKPIVTANMDSYSLTASTTRLVEATRDPSQTAAIHSNTNELRHQTMLLEQIAASTKKTSELDLSPSNNVKNDNFFINGNKSQTSMVASDTKQQKQILDDIRLENDRFPDYLRPGPGAIQVAKGGITT